MDRFTGATSWRLDYIRFAQLKTNVVHYTEITNTNVMTWAWQEVNCRYLSKTNGCDARSTRLSYLLKIQEMLISIMFGQMDDAHDRLPQSNWVGGGRNYDLEICKQVVSRRQDRLASMHTSTYKAKTLGGEPR